MSRQDERSPAATPRYTSLQQSIFVGSATCQYRAQVLTLHDYQPKYRPRGLPKCIHGWTAELTGYLEESQPVHVRRPANRGSQPPEGYDPACDLSKVRLLRGIDVRPGRIATLQGEANTAGAWTTEADAAAEAAAELENNLQLVIALQPLFSSLTESAVGYLLSQCHHPYTYTRRAPWKCYIAFSFPPLATRKPSVCELRSFHSIRFGLQNIY